MENAKYVLGIDVDVWGVMSTIITSLASVFAIFWAVWESKQSARKSRELLEETTRANISIYTEAVMKNSNSFELIIRNFGQSQAIITSVSIDDKTRKEMKINGVDMIDRIINNDLAPGQSITYTFFNPESLKNHLSEISIEYISLPSQKPYSYKLKSVLDVYSKLPTISLPRITTAETYEEEMVYYQKQLNNLIAEHFRRNF